MLRYIFIFLLLVIAFNSKGQGNPFNIKGTQQDSTAITIENTVLENTPSTDSTRTIVSEHKVEVQGNPFEMGNTKKSLQQDIIATPSITKPERKTDEQQETRPIRREEITASNTFSFWIFLVSLILIAAAITIKRDLVPSLINSLTNTNVLKLNMRNYRGGLSMHYILLYLNLFIQLALLGYFIVKYLLHTQQSYIFLVLIILGIYLLKHVVLYLIGFIYRINDSTSEYSFNLITHYIILGILLIPINLFIAFAPEGLSYGLIYIGIICSVLIFLLTRLRGALLLLPRVNTNFFQIFMYLCTFEILPILVIAKFLGDYYSG